MDGTVSREQQVPTHLLLCLYYSHMEHSWLGHGGGSAGIEEAVLWATLWVLGSLWGIVQACN